jgi:hypothetical protein
MFFDPCDRTDGLSIQASTTTFDAITSFDALMYTATHNKFMICWLNHHFIATKALYVQAQVEQGCG